MYEDGSGRGPFGGGLEGRLWLYRTGVGVLLAWHFAQRAWQASALWSVQGPAVGRRLAQAAGFGPLASLASAPMQCTLDVLAAGLSLATTISPRRAWVPAIGFVAGVMSLRLSQLAMDTQDAAAMQAYLWLVVLHPAARRSARGHGDLTAAAGPPRALPLALRLATLAIALAYLHLAVMPGGLPQEVGLVVRAVFLVSAIGAMRRTPGTPSAAVGGLALSGHVWCWTIAGHGLEHAWLALSIPLWADAPSSTAERFPSRDYGSGGLRSSLGLTALLLLVVLELGYLPGLEALQLRSSTMLRDLGLDPRGGTADRSLPELVVSTRGESPRTWPWPGPESTRRVASYLTNEPWRQPPPVVLLGIQRDLQADLLSYVCTRLPVVSKEVFIEVRSGARTVTPTRRLGTCPASAAGGEEKVSVARVGR